MEKARLSSNEKSAHLNNKAKDDNHQTKPSTIVSKETVKAAGFDVNTPIINAIVDNITGVVKVENSEGPDKRKCLICDINCPKMESEFISHVLGSRHKRKLASIEAMKTLGKEKGIHFNNGETESTFKCMVCLVGLNSVLQLHAHLSGVKHTKRSERSGLDNPFKKSSGASKKKTKSFKCDICRRSFVNEVLFLEHFSSITHALNVQDIAYSRKGSGERSHHRDGKYSGR